MMKIIKKTKVNLIKHFFKKVHQDNLFLLSSSISYYSAVAIAPFLLILLGVAAFIGGDIQIRIFKFAFQFSPELGKMIQLIFTNLSQEINFSSTSGFLGLILLFLTASLVFLQLRYAMDVIYENHEIRKLRSIWDSILEKIIAMLIIFFAGLFIILASSLPTFLSMVLPEFAFDKTVYLLNFLIFLIMFWGIHFYSPTVRPSLKDSLIMAFLTSLFFVMGNFVLGFYFRVLATSSIYGAAGSILVFMIWSYYSSFTFYLSAEVYLFYKKFVEESTPPVEDQEEYGITF